MMSNETEKTSVELTTATSRVIVLLKNYPFARNSDNALCEHYYREYEALEVPLTKVKTPLSTIIRVRRKIQRENPSLAPTDEKVKRIREQKSKDFRQIFGDDLTNERRCKEDD